MPASAEIPRRHTPQFQAELDSLIDRLNAGEAVVRSDVRWQLRSSIVRLCVLAIPAAFVAQRFVLGDGDPGIGFFVLGAAVLVAAFVEGLIVVRKLRGRPTFTLRREGFALDGGGIVPWTHVFAILPAERRRFLRGQTLTAYLEAERVDDAYAQLPPRLRLRHRVGSSLRRLDQGPGPALRMARFVVVLRHPAESADVVADLANFLRLRAND